MKKTNIIYWSFTGLFAALMLFSSIPNIICNAESITFLNAHLGYPVYFIPFIGVAKALGVIGILIPVSPRLKEWAYAGLSFDLLGAIYSLIAVDGLSGGIFFMILPIALGIGSYIFHHKKLELSASLAIA